MTILSDRPTSSDQAPQAPQRKKKSPGSMVVSWLTSTDHKVIGYMYLILATFGFCSWGDGFGYARGAGDTRLAIRFT